MTGYDIIAGLGIILAPLSSERPGVVGEVKYENQ